MSTPEPFRPGDPLHPLTLPQSDGTPFDLAAQTIAGQPRLLVLGRPPEGPRLEAAARAAEARGAVVLVVSGARPDGAARAGRSGCSTRRRSYSPVWASPMGVPR